MKYLPIVLLVLFVLQVSVVRAQPPESIELSSILIEAGDTSEYLPLIIEEKVITNSFRSSSGLIKELKKFLPQDSSGNLLIHRSLVFKHCTFTSTTNLSDITFTNSLNFYGCVMNDLSLNGHFNRIELKGNTANHIWIYNSSMESDLVVQNNTTDYIKVSDNNLYGILNLRENNLQKHMEISGNKFHFSPGIACELSNDTLLFQRPFYHGIQLDIKSDITCDLLLSNNDFLSDTPYQRVKIRGMLTELTIEHNHFQSTLDLTALSIERRLILSENTFEGYIAFNDLVFPEHFNLIRWDQIKNNKIIVLEKISTSNKSVWLELVECEPQIMRIEDKDEIVRVPYHGINRLELASDNSFEKLIYSYKSLYTIYNTRGDLESANSCYSEMKEVQQRRLEHIYLTQGGFKNYFRWKLNRLLKIYTNHGTDPALALVISVYVIIAFAFLYYFFPSEWDISSKSKLISDFREFIEKNEKGYTKPFIAMVVGFSISMINAITLSLNSFTTLGFGNIPTKGFARYICIIEGFIGWFLLSIFTVALINQVLA